MTTPIPDLLAASCRAFALQLKPFGVSDVLSDAAYLIQQQLATIERLAAALEDCFAAACDYNLDERAHRNKITAIARTALGKDAK